MDEKSLKNQAQVQNAYAMRTILYAFIAAWPKFIQFRSPYTPSCSLLLPVSRVLKVRGKRRRERVDDPCGDIMVILSELYL